MFVINIYLRFGLIALLLGGGIWLIVLDGFGFWYAFPLLLIGLVLLAGYLFLGTVASSAQLVQEQRLDEAEKRLNLTLLPSWLYSANKAFYYILKGTLAMNRKELDESENWLRIAKSVKLPSDNERAMVELQLANIAASRSNWQKAQAHLRNVKEFNVTEPMLKEQIKQFEKGLAQQGQTKAAMMMGGKKGAAMAFRPGGKRKRPKMK